MLEISPADIAASLRADNPWWRGPLDAAAPPMSWPRRAYFGALLRVLRQPVQRAVVLLGARRVGKTTILRQLIGEASASGEFGPILFASLDTPVLGGLPLEKLLDLFTLEVPHDPNEKRLVVFDEVQYLLDWERHLKVLVDRFPATRFIASGSAGAALRRKSSESGAGRFTDFDLPPLTFAEFLDFRGEAGAATDARRLEALFVEYVNYGGYPEVALNEAVRADLGRFVRQDIIDKVLLRDLPTLYGITNIPELNRLFTVLAYNTGQEVSLEALAQNSGITKPTIQRYLEYLEAAFLIVRVRRVDETARRLVRQRNYKVFLTNPSMRAALFGPVGADDAAMGPLAETALVAQLLHSSEFAEFAYARWSSGEVDLVRVDAARQVPVAAVEVKWSDEAWRDARTWSGLVEFASRHDLRGVLMTARTVRATRDEFDPQGKVIPLPLLCLELGRAAVAQATGDAAVLARLGLSGAAALAP